MLNSVTRGELGRTIKTHIDMQVRSVKVVDGNAFVFSSKDGDTVIVWMKRRNIVTVMRNALAKAKKGTRNA